MKKHIHFITIFIFLLCATLIFVGVIHSSKPSQTHAATRPRLPKHTPVIMISPNGTIDSGPFEPMTREEYLMRKVLKGDLSYRDAEADLTSNIQIAVDELKNLEEEDGDATINHPNEDKEHIVTQYGTVHQIFVSESGKQADYSADVVLLQSVYGSAWVECITHGESQRYGDGNYELNGFTVAYVMSPRKLYLSCSGCFETAIHQRIGLKMDFGWFYTTYKPGHTMYYRESMHDSVVVHLDSSI